MGKHFRNKATVVYCEECGNSQVSFGGELECSVCQRKTVFVEFVPTLEQIRAKCEQIQKTWSRQTRKSRSAYKTGSVFANVRFVSKKDERAACNHEPMRLYKNREYVQGPG
jgi:uncharacterized Zn finger protein (UPF0148 family)